jgi:hypothetical protein
MLFSGTSRLRRCTRCGREHGDFFPSSLIPFGSVVGVGIPIWTTWLSCVGLGNIASIWTGIGLAVVYPVLVLLLFELHCQFYLRKCRGCGGTLEIVCTGFYHTMIPPLSEILIYVVSIATPWFLCRWCQHA